MELCFECRTDLGSFQGQVQQVLGACTVHPDPVVRPDTFADGKGVSIYGTVLRDGADLRMWYLTMPESWDGTCDMNSVAHATSQDGIEWHKTPLGLVECGLEPNHLTDLGLHSATVFIDPVTTPEQRYRAIGCAMPGHFMCHPGATLGGYYTAHSADGLRWHLDQPTPQWNSADVITAAWHPQRASALISLKRTPRVARMHRRSIHQAVFRNGTYGSDVAALYPDETDDIAAAARGFHSCDYYGMGMLPAGQGMVGFIWNYWHALPYTGDPGSPVALYGTSDVTLVYQQHEGGMWHHVPGRPVFIDRLALPWTSGWINTSSTPVEVGDEHRLYYSGQPGSHGFPLGTNWQPLPGWETARRDSGITFASWPQWRLFGLETETLGSFSIDLGEATGQQQAWLNLSTRPGGWVKLQALDASGALLAEADPLTGDSLRAGVTWPGGNAALPADCRQLRLNLREATVWAWEIGVGC